MVFRSEDESTFLPVPLFFHRCVALGGTYNPGIASTVPFFLLSLRPLVKRGHGVIRTFLCDIYSFLIMQLVIFF